MIYHYYSIWISKMNDIITRKVVTPHLKCYVMILFKGGLRLFKMSVVNYRETIKSFLSINDQPR